MTRLSVLIPVLSLLSLSAASAQTAAVTRTLEWTYTQPPSVVATYAHTVKVSGGAEQAVTPACVADGSGTRCSAPVAGGTSYQVVAYNGFGATASNVLTGTPPGTPVVSVTITLKIP